MKYEGQGLERLFRARWVLSAIGAVSLGGLSL